VKFKLDENISRHLKSPLQQLGHDVHTVEDEGLLGHPDTEVANAAKAEGRTLLTLDLEFADLRKYPPGEHPGIVLFRPRTLGPLSVNEFIVEFVRHGLPPGLVGSVAVVEPERVRIRRPEK